MSSKSEIPDAETVLVEWIEHFGGADECDCENSPHHSRHCTFCGCPFEDDEQADLDPAHDEDCLILRTCMVLHGKPQRVSTQRGCSHKESGGWGCELQEGHAPPCDCPAALARHQQRVKDQIDRLKEAVEDGASQEGTLAAKAKIPSGLP